MSVPIPFILSNLVKGYNNKRNYINIYRFGKDEFLFGFDVNASFMGGFSNFKDKNIKQMSINQGLDKLTILTKNNEPIKCEKCGLSGQFIESSHFIDMLKFLKEDGQDIYDVFGKKLEWML